MLVTTKFILDKARNYGFGVAAPNVLNMETTEAVFEAAAELDAPIIIDVAEIHGPEKLGEMVKYFSKKYPDVIAALNLDHSLSFDIAIKAIKQGYTSIMIDRSTLPFEENVAQVQEIVKIAHAVGVSVEAELGHVGQGDEYEKTRDAGLTSPEEAVEYVKRTGVDILAVAVGTSHGIYKGIPHIDFKLLEEISNTVDVPLVLHGGSGTGDENLKKAVKKGIQKINLLTDLSNGALKAVNREMKQDMTEDFIAIQKAIKKGYNEVLKYYIKLFGSDGKAKFFKS